jgi:hypothetical protein
MKLRPVLGAHPMGLVNATATETRPKIGANWYRTMVIQCTAWRLAHRAIPAPLVLYTTTDDSTCRYDVRGCILPETCLERLRGETPSFWQNIVSKGLVMDRIRCVEHELHLHRLLTPSWYEASVRRHLYLKIYLSATKAPALQIIMMYMYTLLH